MGSSMVIPDHEERLARLERLAKPGRENTFTGLALQDNLDKKGAMARCAIQVVSLKNGDIPHEIRLVGDIRELFDVAVIPNVRVPGSVGFLSDEIWKRITIESDMLPA